MIISIIIIFKKQIILVTYSVKIHQLYLNTLKYYIFLSHARIYRFHYITGIIYLFNSNYQAHYF